MKLCCAFFVAALSFLSNGYAEHNYYFSSDTKTEGDGSKAQPFHSLQKLSALKLHAGDTVFFKGGDTLAGNVVLNDFSGTEDHAIVFTSYGERKPVVDG